MRPGSLSVPEAAFIDEIDKVFGTGVTGALLKKEANKIASLRTSQGITTDIFYISGERHGAQEVIEYQGMFSTLPSDSTSRNQFFISAIYINGRVKHIFVDCAGDALPDRIDQSFQLGVITRSQ